MRAVGEAHARRVLQRHPAARVDGLRLAEHEGQLLAFGHRRFQPLQAGRLRRGLVGDAHVRVLRRRLDGQLAAENPVGLRQVELQRRPGAGRVLAFDLLDAQIAGVQHQLPGGLVLPFQRVAGGAGQLLVVEIDRQIQCEVLDGDLARFGIGAFIVTAFGLHGGRGGLGGGGLGSGGGFFGAAGRQHGGAGQGQQYGAHQGFLRQGSAQFTCPPPGCLGAAQLGVAPEANSPSIPLFSLSTAEWRAKGSKSMTFTSRCTAVWSAPFAKKGGHPRQRVTGD